MEIDEARVWLQRHADNTPMPGAREVYKTILEALEKMRWIPGSVKPTKEGEKAICLTDYGNVVLGEVISYQGELIWEEFTVFGGTFTPKYWLRIPELPKEGGRTA